jgi:Xaa-Pro dipeptidase
MRTPSRSTSPTRRDFLRATAATSVATFATPSSLPAWHPQETADPLPPAFSGLSPLGAKIRPIATDEFAERITHAQNLMSGATPAGDSQPAKSKFDAIFLAQGTSFYYFTGVRWSVSERLLGLVIPHTGQPILVVPAFEEGRLREKLKLPMDVRTWQEDESPTKIAAAALAERGIRTGTIGVEEATAFTFYDHFREAAPGFQYVSADPIAIACRARKSPHELELMRLACAATFDVFRSTFASLKEGMSQDDIGSLITRGFAKMNLQGGALVLLGASAALPHGSVKPQKLKDGDVVLIDGECLVEGYPSDVTRTSVFGKPSEKISRAFDIVRQAQDAALDAARAGRLAGTVDDAARKVIVDAGYGPGYKYFTHRLGHGLGLDEHEHPYLVHGSKTLLETSMTFSNEPGIYIPNEFGLRCEDDMAISLDGPAQLLTPNFASSLEKPFG